MGKEREVMMVGVLDVRRSTSEAIASWCLTALWSGLRRRRHRHRRTYALGLKLNYDALSYAQNFDDGCRGVGECEPDFTARFAPSRRPSVASCS